MPEWNERRRENASIYSDLLSNVDGIIAPFEPEWTRAVYHLYIVRTQDRDELQKFLSDNNIATGLHYPIPLHLQKAYSSMGYNEGDFPISEKLSKEILSLPMYPQLTEYQIAHVADKIKEFLSTNHK